MAPKRNLRDRLTSLLELPGDVMLNSSRITVVGAKELWIENHRGLYEFTPDKVVLAVPEGRLTIAGEALNIGAISPDQLTLMGSIHAILYSD